MTLNSPRIILTKTKPKVLVVPLDWGLGHATRCLPLIKSLLEKGFEVEVAANKLLKEIINQEYPYIKIIDLAGYGVKYAESDFATILRIIFQIPKLLMSIKRENQWLTRILSLPESDYNLVISDNRYGLFSSLVPCIFITHQLHIKTPFGRLGDRLVNRINYHYINKFNACWVPDSEGDENLSGELSHPDQMPSIPVKYIGPVTRMKQIQTDQRIDLLIILSGPEPQRSRFEQIILSQLAVFPGKAVLVRGLPLEKASIREGYRAEIFNYLASAELNRLICESHIVICRSGYSSVMDLLKLEKRIVMVPTPGQPEQEYLAAYLAAKKYILTLSQNAFDLQQAYTHALTFDFKFPANGEDDLLSKAIDEIIKLQVQE